MRCMAQTCRDASFEVVLDKFVAASLGLLTTNIDLIDKSSYIINGYCVN